MLPQSRHATLVAIVLWLGAGLVGATAVASAHADSAAIPGAVVFAYSRFGEDRTPAINIRLDQFEAHLDELAGDEYAVLPLPRIIEALKAGKPLPDRAVAITIDDASRSVYREAFPRLRAAGLPFTLFVATSPVDRGSGTHMTWPEIRELAKAGVTIGAMTASALPMAGRDGAEIRDDLQHMADRFRAELGSLPTLFAYPYGEYSLAVRTIVEAEGFAAAFGQQSGVAYAGADRLALPRFVMNEAFGTVERFQLAANALALPVTDVTPADPVLVANPPNLGFTVPTGLDNLERLACFASGQGRTTLERLDTDRIEVRVAEPFPAGRARVNCTLPTDDGRWRWFGVQFFVPD
ncbi:MAG: polysaccharide deacetylase family protein [Azospirillum sp.]|nr:polysaccharide deacetylase family protein [Azospirillum sp.]